MKTSKVLFFSTITVFGVMFAVFAVMAQSTTPSFEVSATEGPSVDGQIQLSTTQVDQNETLSIQATVSDVSGVDTVSARIVNSNGVVMGQLALNDSGLGGDATAGDGIYSISWNIGSKPNGVYNVELVMKDKLGNPSIVQAADSLTVVGAPNDFSCNSDADCYEQDALCCGGECVFNSCSIDDDCVRCVNGEVGPDGECTLGTETGVCNTGCSNTCDYTSTPTCTVDSDCASSPSGHTDYDECCNGDCTVRQCIDDTDCLNGSCNKSSCPYMCDYNDDTTAPFVSIIGVVDINGSTTQPFTDDTVIVKAMVTDMESGVDYVNFEVDGTTTYTENFEYDSVSNPDEYWRTIGGLNTGSHTIIVSGVDTAGNVNEAQVTIEFDLGTTTAPIIDDFSTDKTSYASGESMQVQINAHDDSNITNIELFSSGVSGPVITWTYAQPTVNLTAGVGAANIVDLLDAYNNYAYSEHKFRLPFIKAADAEIVGNQNCTTTTNNYNRNIYAMVHDGTNPATQSNSIGLVVSVTSTNCVPYSVNSGVTTTPSGSGAM